MKGFKPTLPAPRLLGPRFNNTDQIDLYDDVLTATSQPSDDEAAALSHLLLFARSHLPSPITRPLQFLYTYSGLRNRRAAVYVGSFSWVSMGNQKAWVGWRESTGR